MANDVPVMVAAIVIAEGAGLHVPKGHVTP